MTLIIVSTISQMMITWIHDSRVSVSSDLLPTAWCTIHLERTGWFGCYSSRQIHKHCRRSDPQPHQLVDRNDFCHCLVAKLLLGSVMALSHLLPVWKPFKSIEKDKRFQLWRVKYKTDVCLRKGYLLLCIK